MGARKPAGSEVPTDAQERLLVEAAQKDPAQFSNLYEIHFERIYAFIARRVRDRNTAEDLTSDVFHKALANLRTFECRGAPFAAWLMRIAANAIADQSKRAAREVPGLDDPPEHTAQPDLEAIEHRARLFRMVNLLPGEQRHVIVQRFVDQMSTREIAQQLGKTEGAIKQLQFRALQSLRAQMEGGNA
jgi:RNA polymerase sigma-70 factor (ECF subfamily)